MKFVWDILKKLFIKFFGKIGTFDYLCGMKNFITSILIISVVGCSSNYNNTQQTVKNGKNEDVKIDVIFELTDKSHFSINDVVENSGMSFNEIINKINNECKDSCRHSSTWIPTELNMAYIVEDSVFTGAFMGYSKNGYGIEDFTSFFYTLDSNGVFKQEGGI